MTLSITAPHDLSVMRQPAPASLVSGGYDDIVVCADAYRDAMAALDLPTRLGASEDVLRARLALAECLMNVGWQPTGRMLAVIHRDEDLLLESNGALDPPPPCRPE